MSETKIRGSAKPYLTADLELEQGLLGMALNDPNVIEDLPDNFHAQHFYEPSHGRIFEQIKTRTQNGNAADPFLIASYLETDQGVRQLGGEKFLIELFSRAPPRHLAKSYAERILDLWRRRALLELSDRITEIGFTDAPTEEMIQLVEKDVQAIQALSSISRTYDAAEAVAMVLSALDDPQRASGVKCGLSPIDDVNGGMMPGELWLGAGRPGMGKSAVANSAALHIARFGRSPDNEPLGVIEFGSEMTVEQMMRRHVCDIAYEMFGSRAPAYSTVRKRNMTLDQSDCFRAAAKEVSKLGTLSSIYRTGLTIPAMRAIIRRQSAAWRRKGVKPGLVTVDHVGLIRSSQKAKGRTEAQGEIARELKELAGELDIPIFALVQLNRQVEQRDDKRPMLADLRDSGEWEENADGVIAFYRDAYYAKREPQPKGYDRQNEWEERCNSPFVDAIFMKIREGETQTVKLWADMGRNAIRGAAPDLFYDSSAFL